MRDAGGPYGAGALPTFVVVGAQKCGTTALHRYLSAHPSVQMSTPKELDYFVAERNWSRGPAWYASHFDPSSPVRGESSPNYTVHPRWAGVPERLTALVPDVRVVYCVRDPVERIASQWVHNRARRREPADLARCLRPTSFYVLRSRYMLQLEQYLRRLPEERVLVVEQRDLLRDRLPTLARVFAFLGVAPDFVDPRFDREAHRSSAKHRPSAPVASLDRRLDRVLDRSPLRGLVRPRLAARVEARLNARPVARPDVLAAMPAQTLELLREDAARLRAHTGRPLADWSV